MKKITKYIPQKWRHQFFYLRRYIARFGLTAGINVFFKFRFKKNGIGSVKIKELREPLHIRRNTSDIESFDQTFIETSLDIFRNLKSGWMIDLGANCGMFSVQLLNQVENIKLIAVEPDPGNLEILRRNLEKYAQTTIIPMGIWSSKTRVAPLDSSASNWALRFEPTDSSEGIETTTIHEIIEQNQIDSICLVKIDIEGTEIELFSENYQWLQIVDRVWLETHDRFRPGCSEKAKKALKEHGFDIDEMGHHIIATKTN